VIGEEVKVEENKKATMASTLIETNKTILDEEKKKFAIEEEAEIEEKKRLTLAATSIEEQALQKPAALMPKTISDRRKPKLPLRRRQRLERRRAQPWHQL
jgi:hypothetical protein